MSDQFAEQFRSAGVLPSGPVSPWPRYRQIDHATTVKASAGSMIKSAIKNAGRGINGGSVNREIREERFKTCKACPSFVKKTERCSECGCFMKLKTWVNADADVLCPLQKWDR